MTGSVSLSMVDHGAPDCLAVGRCLKLGRDPAPRHNADTIGETENFIEVVADQQDGGAAGARLEKSLMDRRASAHVQAAAGAMRHDDLRISSEFARENQLLRVAA